MRIRCQSARWSHGNGRVGQDVRVTDLAFEMHFGENLATSDHLDALQLVLARRFPKFGAGLLVLEYETDREGLSVRLGDPGELRKTVLDKGGRRGPMFDQLEKQNGQTAYERRFGEALIRTDTPSTFLTVRFDEYAPGMPSGDKWLFSNSIGGWTSRSSVAGHDRAEFIGELFNELAGLPSLLWGGAFMNSEFRERNLHDDHDGVWAVGRDIRRSLPGLYWMNAFGSPYIETIGADRLRRGGATALPASSNLVIKLYDAPEDWNTESARQNYRSILDRLGQEHFYDRDNPASDTVAPDFGLAELSPRSPLQAITADGEHYTVVPTAEELIGRGATSEPRRWWQRRRRDRH